MRGRHLLTCDSRESQRAPAFTLIELLVVVAIIALLIAILLPSLKKARDQAKRAACASNLAHIATAWHMYLDGNRGRFLLASNANINFAGKQGTEPAYGGIIDDDPLTLPNPVFKPLNMYLGLPLLTTEADMMRCPADKGGGLAPISYYHFYGSSYGTNTLMIGQNSLFLPSLGPCQSVMMQVNARLPALNQSQLSSESKLILAGDAGWVNTWHPGSSTAIEWHQRAKTHNLAFMDGHVEFIRLRKGIHTCGHYTVIPWRDLQEQACPCQQEVLMP